MSSNPVRFAARVSYLGTRYIGWQKQRGAAGENGDTIQETIEKSLAQITSEPGAIVGSGRTDSGVHSVGQVFHFSLSKEWETSKLLKGLNSLLPSDIRILALEAVSPDFHAQKSATKKQYSYYFQQGPSSLPHLEETSWWIRKKFDLEGMAAAAGHLVGRHDFAPFQAAGGAVKSTVREILEVSVDQAPVSWPVGAGEGLGQHGYEMVRLRLVGTGFLKQMVRGIAGTLIEVGDGRRGPDTFRAILKSQLRADLGATAPARGLWLEKVWYEPGQGWNS